MEMATNPDSGDLGLQEIQPPSHSCDTRGPWRRESGGGIGTARGVTDMDLTTFQTGPAGFDPSYLHANVLGHATKDTNQP